jgi:hypothetical protein
MHHAICFIMLLITSFPLMGQQRGYSLHGNIVEQSSGKRPVRGVVVKSLFSNQQTSGDQGEFTLTFAEAGPGSNVTITAEKDKWVIVNDKNMTLNLPDNEKFRLPIVMCEASKLEALKKEFNNITDSVIRAGYEAKLRKLDRKAEGWEKKAAELGAEMQRLYREAQETAEMFAHVNLDEITGTERLAFDTFRAGYLDESIRLRESMESRRKLLANKQTDLRADSAKRALDNARANRQQENLAHIRNLRSLATEKRLKFEFGEAEKCLRTLVEYDSTSYEFVAEYAYFLAAQNAHDSALRWFNTASRIAADTYGDESWEKAATLMNLGILYCKVGNYDQGASALSLALRIDTRQAGDDPLYEITIALTLNNLGAMYREMRNYPAADTALSQCMKIRIRLAKENPGIHEPDLAATLDNLGNLYSDMHSYRAADSVYTKALEIRNRLAKANPDTYEPDLAMTLNNLGKLYRDMHNYRAADTVWSQAVLLKRRLAKRNPSANEPSLALALNNLGTLFVDMRNYPAADTAYSQALEILMRLAEKNPDAYQPDLAMTLNNTGTLYFTIHNFGAADTAYTDALEIRKRLAVKNPDVYEPDVAVTLNNLGALYLSIHSYTAADSVFTQALEIYKRLAKKIPDAYEPYVAHILNAIGILYGDKRNYPAADAAFVEAIEIYERLAKKNPYTFQPIFAATLRKRSIIYLYLDNNHGADSALVQSVEIYRTLTTAYPGIYESDLASTLHVLSLLCSYTNKYSAAAKTLSEAIELNSRLVEAESVNYSPIDIGKDYGSLSWYLLFARRYADAEQAARKALYPSIAEKPTGYDAAVQWVFTNLAHSLLLQGKYAEAEKIYLPLKDQAYNDEKTYGVAFLTDLDELEKAGITHPDMAKVRALLK